MVKAFNEGELVETNYPLGGRTKPAEDNSRHFGECDYVLKETQPTSNIIGYLT